MYVRAGECQVQIHQFVHTLNYGDAISGEAITIRRLLRERGIDSSIYSVHAHEKVEGCVRRIEDFSSDLRHAREAGEDVRVVLHYSIASLLNQLLIQTEGISKVMIYHNLTPDRWYAPYNQRVTRDLRTGRRELPLLLKQMDWVLADSEYNARELLGFGHSEAQVLPLVQSSVPESDLTSPPVGTTTSSGQPASSPVRPIRPIKLMSFIDTSGLKSVWVGCVVLRCRSELNGLPRERQPGCSNSQKKHAE